MADKSKNTWNTGNNNSNANNRQLRNNCVNFLRAIANTCCIDLAQQLLDFLVLLGPVYNTYKHLYRE